MHIINDSPKRSDRYFVRPVRLIAGQDEGALLFGGFGAHAVADPRLGTLVARLAPFMGGQIDAEQLDRELDALFAEDSLRVLSHLTTVIPMLIPQRHCAGDRSIRIVSDVPAFAERLKSVLRVPYDCEIHPLGDLETSSGPSTPSNSLIVTFLERYDPNSVKHVYDRFATGPGNSFITAYFFFDRFIIDGLYVPDKGTPCHFCLHEQIRRLEQNTMNIQLYSWASIKKMVGENERSFHTDPEINDADHGLAAYLLRHEVEAVCVNRRGKRFYDEVGLFTEVDLGTFQITRDKVPHWEMCDCLRRSVA